MSARTITRREADFFACVVDTVVAPADGLPPVVETDAVQAFAATLERSPAVNAVGLRVALYLLELAPYGAGRRSRLRRLPRAERVAVLEGLTRTPLAPLVDAIRALAAFCYYGNDTVAARFGWDPDAVVARARALRAEEGRW